jgi:hypothetical protein
LSDYVATCVDTDDNLDVIDDVPSHCASHMLIPPPACALTSSDKDTVSLHAMDGEHSTSHMLTPPRACVIRSCDIMMPLHGSRDARRDDDSHTVERTVIQTLRGVDGDDVRACSGHSRRSLGVGEACADRHGGYVETLSFPCIPPFPHHIAFCAQGIADRRLSLDLSEQILKVARAMASLGQPPRPPPVSNAPLSAKAKARAESVRAHAK